MVFHSDHSPEFQELERRLRIILPATYQESCDSVLPLLMGSANLKYGADGKVAWDQIWGSFCHLAMAGGPPHKGKLLEPASAREVREQTGCYADAVKEICRGVRMVTGLDAKPSCSSGWVSVSCTSAVMAGWLARAIVMENVSSRVNGLRLDLPAGPNYRLEKEIKNVVTVIAKTCHYWVDHTSPEQHESIAELFSMMESESPLVQMAPLDEGPNAETQRILSSTIAASVLRETGLSVSELAPDGWLGLDLGNVRSAISMMRILVVCNTFARREGTIVFVPVNPTPDAEGRIVTHAVVRAHAFAVANQML